MRFGAALHDENGDYTFKPWEGSGFLWKRQVPARGSESDPFRAPLPADARAPFTIEARLASGASETAKAPSKRQAEQAAAKALLKRVERR